MLGWISVNHKPEGYYLKIPRDTNTESKNTLESAHRTIKHIQENYPAPYVLYLSGGIDSQAMLWAWHTSGAKYQAVSYVYNGGLNLHDLDRGMPVFAKDHKIHIERRDIDLMEFYATQYPKYAERYRCGSPHIAAYMYMSDQQTNGTVIFSGSGTLTDNSFYTPNEWRLYHYGHVSGRSIVPAFFSETQDLHYGFLQHVVPGDSKITVYHKAGFPVVQQRPGNTNSEQRYSGFEGIRDRYEQRFEKNFTIEEKLRRLSDHGSNWNFDILLRNPWEWRFRHDKYLIEFVDP